MPASAVSKSKRVRKPLKEINYISDSDVSGYSSDGDVKVSKGRNSLEKAALSKRFQKKDMLEHILLRADVYIGSPDKTEEKVWVFDTEKEIMVHKNIEYSPGLYKIFDEILVNAADNKQRDPSMKSIKVTIERESGVISVQNDGKGIPVEVHQEHNVYIPELIFGHLLTGENFEDTKKRIVGGKNGYGAKLTNIFSDWFEVETVDSKAGLKYTQKWTSNMKKKGDPIIKKCPKKAKDYTKVSFKPDFKRFQSEELEKDTYDLFCKRVYDIAGVTHLSLKVHLNGKKLSIDRFSNYVDLYIKSLHGSAKPKVKATSEDEGTMSSDDEDNTDTNFVKVYEKVNNFWEICITQSTGSFGHLSFVNSICTYKGGKHVDYITDMVVKELSVELNKDKEMKKANIKNSAIKNNLFVFVNSLIVNPTFNSQSKEFLATSSSKFGDKENLPKLANRTIKALCKSEILNSIKAAVNAQNLRKINKKTKGKRSGPLNIDKLEDAKNAGTKKWRQCTLLLTEGDSAKTTAISGLSVIGRDNYGVFPLKGKLLNVRDATHSQITKNKEIENICRIVGLAVGDKVDPQIFSKSSGSRKKGLRYGHIMIMTDQDHDGSHIKGLLFNFIHHYWPELLREVPNFVQVFITPIVKCFPKNEKKEVLSFYTMPEYENWCEENKNNLGKYVIKYYKGLGTSSKKEAKEYFKDIKKHKIQMKCDKEENLSGKSIELAFSKKKAAARKVWLTEYNEKYGAGDNADGYVDFSINRMTYSTFVNKELVHFSLADNIRSIPSAVDGLKPSQRKVLYGAIKKFLSRKVYSKETMKVASLCGYVSGVTAYHHGEQSMQGTIVSMAQDFVGSNNINFLVPAGQFGSRLAGGKDASQARYISTGVTRILTKVFRKEDEGILHYLEEEGKVIEPEYFLPILPTVLVNGAQGIGTGWSTDIAMHNPKDLVQWLKRRMNRDEGSSGGSIVELHPWYRGYKGIIEKTKAAQYKSKAIYSLDEDDYTDEYTLRITELPINKWTNDYKRFLSDMHEKDVTSNIERIKGISNDSSDDTVDFTIQLSKEFYTDLSKDRKLLIKLFGLEKAVSGTTNMHLFDYKHRIRKYENQHEILEEFYLLRKKKYEERKLYLTEIMEAEREKLANEQRFVYEVANGIISITRRKRQELVAELEERGYVKLSDKPIKKSLADDPTTDDDSEDSDESGKSYSYLLKIPILSLTMEKVEKIKNKLQDVTDKLELYKDQKILDMWRGELDEFLEEYEVYLADTGCLDIEQETIVPDSLKQTVDVVGRPSMAPAGGFMHAESGDKTSLSGEVQIVSPKKAASNKRDIADMKNTDGETNDSEIDSVVSISEDELPKATGKRKSTSSTSTKTLHKKMVSGSKSSSRSTIKNQSGRSKQLKKTRAQKKKQLEVIDSELSDFSISDAELEKPTNRKRKSTVVSEASESDLASDVSDISPRKSAEKRKKQARRNNGHKQNTKDKFQKGEPQKAINSEARYSINKNDKRAFIFSSDDESIVDLTPKKSKPVVKRKNIAKVVVGKLLKAKNQKVSVIDKDAAAKRSDIDGSIHSEDEQYDSSPKIATPIVNKRRPTRARGGKTPVYTFSSEDEESEASNDDGSVFSEEETDGSFSD